MKIEPHIFRISKKSNKFEQVKVHWFQLSSILQLYHHQRIDITSRLLSFLQKPCENNQYKESSLSSNIPYTSGIS